MQTGLWGLLAVEMAEQEAWPREPVTAFRALTGDPRNEGDGDAAGDDGAAAGEPPGGSAETDAAAAPPDFAAMFSDFSTTVLEKVEGLERRLPVPAEEDDDDEDEEAAATPFFDPRDFADDDFDDDGNLKREAQQRGFQSFVKGIIEAERAPERAAAQAARRTSEANDLEKRHPVFADPKARAPHIAQAQQYAAHLAQTTGNKALADSWREPSFLEMVYLAKGAGAAAQTAGGEQGNVKLESGGSASPGAASDDGGKATAKRIVGLAQSTRFRLGTGGKTN